MAYTDDDIEKPRKKGISYKKLRQKRLPYQRENYSLDKATDALRETFGHICRNCVNKQFCVMQNGAAILNCNKKTEKTRKFQPNKRG